MADALSLPARFLAVADLFDALSAKRPYRDALPLEKVFSICGKMPRMRSIGCVSMP